MVPGGVMLPGGEKTTPEVGGCPGCCCYCDLYSLAEYVYRDRLSYPPPPLAYSPMPPCPTHGEEKTTKEEDLPVIHPPPSPHMSPDVTLAFLLSLDLLRSLPQQHALHHALESRGLLKHACECRPLARATWACPCADVMLLWLVTQPSRHLVSRGGEPARRPGRRPRVSWCRIACARLREVVSVLILALPSPPSLSLYLPS